MIYGRQCFFAGRMIWLLPHPFLPSPVSKLSLFLSLTVCRRSGLMTGGGRGLGRSHKVLTYIEYRAGSGVFRTIDPPTPSTASECVLPRTKGGGGGGTHSPGGEGLGVNISEDARHWIGLLQYKPSTVGANAYDREKAWFSINYSMPIYQ